MFYGMGAGKYPTASAVVSDIVACLTTEPDAYRGFLENDEPLLSVNDIPMDYCLAVEAEISLLIARIPSLVHLSSDGKVEYILCENMSQKAILEALGGISVLKCMRAII